MKPKKPTLDTPVALMQPPAGYADWFAAAWPEAEIVRQAVAQLPWGHNLVLLTKLKMPQTRLIEREGKVVINFESWRPSPQSDLARESLKDPYRG